MRDGSGDAAAESTAGAQVGTGGDGTLFQDYMSTTNT